MSSKSNALSRTKHLNKRERGRQSGTGNCRRDLGTRAGLAAFRHPGRASSAKLNLKDRVTELHK